MVFCGISVYEEEIEREKERKDLGQNALCVLRCGRKGVAPSKGWCHLL